MSIDDLLRLAETNNWVILSFLLGLPVATFLLAKMYKKTPGRNSLDYVFTVLIYAIAIPGMFSFCLVGYSFMFIHQNMLQVNMVIYFLPLISMGLVFYLISRATDFDRLPGFKKLSALMLLMFLVMAVLFFLYRLRIHMVFFGSISNLFWVGLGIFVLMKIAMSRLKS